MQISNKNNLPVAIIGAGPVGLAAAAHLAQRGENFVLLEAGPSIGASIMKWGHVKLFSPWRYVVDKAALGLLAPTGWRMPDPEADPLGAELVRDYLQPLAALPAINKNLRLNTRVISVARKGFDKLKTNGRERAPFVLTLQTELGQTQMLAKAVIDASGTWETPNPLGANGTWALGEQANRDRITYGIPDVLDADRARYSGKNILVVGSGHSAFNAVIELEHLAQQAPDTRITWAVRREQAGQMFGGLSDDQLSQRGALGERAQSVVARGLVKFEMGVKIERVECVGEQVHIYGDGDRVLGPFDEVIACTGFRPDLSILSELRLKLDEQVDAPVALAPLIDPNVHSCGSVPPHGYEELKHPEPDIYVVGMKSYGRAPTFLMLTGYEQVRSVVAAIAGDLAAARAVQLVLPETGVCGGANCGTPTLAGGVNVVEGCCGAPATKTLASFVSLDSLFATIPVAAGVATSGCCSTEKQAVCCEPADKAECCGAANSAGSCGCN